MSSRRKQEEKHLQTLKGLQQVACNKKCFECDQRGPTYVDVTIGSFVCTSCGGILRGLNPPHRVKSVSMATFTPTEIAFIETRGNEYCKNIYLGKYDSRSKARPESRSDHGKLKFFMEQKYEQKRWYVPPEQAQKPLDSFMKAATNGANKSDSKVKPLTSLLGNNAASVKVEKLASPKQPKVDNIIADFGSINNAPSNANQQNVASSGGFADFSNAFSSSSSFDAFGDFTTGQTSSAATAPSSDGFANFGNVLAPMSTTASANQQQPAAPASKVSDKYADLSDLFSMDANPGTTDITSMWSAKPSSGATTNQNTSVFGMSSAQQPSNMTSVFGNTPPTSGFGAMQPQQQQGVFGAQMQTPAFGNMQQSGLMNMQNQTQPSAALFGSMQQPHTQQGAVFGNPSQQNMSAFGGVQQTPMSTSAFGGMQQTPTSSFGGMQQTPMTNSNFGGMQQTPTSSFGGMQQTPMSTASFGGMQQTPMSSSNFGGMQQTPMSTAPFGGMQQTPMSTSSFGASQFNTAGTYGGQQASTIVANPFLQPAASAAMQSAPGGSNPFMMQQQAQKPFPAQSNVTNPFMNNPPQQNQQMPTNPFF